MKIFVTGATGYLGSAIAARLARGGHEVWGLTRDSRRTSALATLGVRPVIGDLAKRESFVGVLQNCDAAIHAATDYGDTAARDQQALEAIRAAVQDGHVRRLIYTSGVWVHGDTGGRVIDESAPLAPLALVRWRPAHEELALDLVDLDASVVVFRPGIVYGESRSIIGGLFAEAAKEHTVTFPGDGSQFWPLVHRDDLAEAYALAIEHAKGGERYLLSDESKHTVREIAEAIAKATGAAAHPWPREAVMAKLGAYGEALLTSGKVTAAKARRDLGWVPSHTSLVNEADALYREWQSSQQTTAA